MSLLRIWGGSACAVQFVDGALQNDGGPGMSAPENRERVLKQGTEDSTQHGNRQSTLIVKSILHQIQTDAFLPRAETG